MFLTARYPLLHFLHKMADHYAVGSNLRASFENACEKGLAGSIDKCDAAEIEENLLVPVRRK